MLQRVLGFLIVLLVLPDVYIYRTFIKQMTLSLFWRILYFIPTLLLMAGVVTLAFFANHEYTGRLTLWIGNFAVIFFLFASPKLLFTICSIIGRPFNRWLHWPRTPFIATGLVLAVLNVVLILYGSIIGKERFEVKELDFRSSRLPEAFKGYRIVQLSDIHIGSWQGKEKSLQKMVDLVNAQKPDLIVFTGDLINNRAIELNGFEEILSQLHAKDGVYSVLGNHDYGPYYRWKSKRDQVNNLNDLKRRQADMGWVLLNNEHTFLHRKNDSIALIGVENEGEPPFSQHGDLPKAQAGTNGLFKLLLSHNPTHWRREVLPQSDIDLMLTGHTHGMQLAVNHHSPASWIYPEWGGLYTEGNRGLYVNVGIGFVGLPFRFGAWPEITVITLDK